MRIRLTEEIWKEGNMYVSYCPELDVASCGESVEQAKINLKDALSINFEETKRMGTFDQFLQEAGFEDFRFNTCRNRIDSCHSADGCHLVAVEDRIFRQIDFQPGKNRLSRGSLPVFQEYLT